MTTQICTLLPVSNLSDLKHEWRVMAFRPNGSGFWDWNINLLDVSSFHSMLRDGLIVSVQRRDPDGTRLLAKVKGRK